MDAMKLLVADDEPIARTLIERWLRGWGYEVVVARDGAEAMRALETDTGIRIALLDWIMPGMDGIDITRAIRKRPPEPYVFVVLLTVKDNKSDIIAGLEAGADDYIVKPCNPLELKVRLRAGQRIVELQEQLIEAREKMRHAAMHDALTGLPNRAAALTHLDEELARAQRSGAPLSVMMVDLDHFKRVNDTYGHAAGDVVLREAASRFRGSVRAYDGVGRLGGEEFLVVMPECPDDAAVHVAQRLRKQLRGSSFVVPGAPPLTVTASVGVASTQGRSTADASELIAAADRALYRAKDAGRDRTVLARADDWETIGEPTRTPLPLRYGATS